jgi:hypothetical protein
VTRRIHLLFQGASFADVFAVAGHDGFPLTDRAGARRGTCIHGARWGDRIFAGIGVVKRMHREQPRSPIPAAVSELIARHQHALARPAIAVVEDHGELVSTRQLPQQVRDADVHRLFVRRTRIEADVMTSDVAVVLHLGSVVKRAAGADLRLGGYV